MVDGDEVNASYWDVLRVLSNYRYLDVSDRKLGSMIRINKEIHWGYNPLILAFDPNFLVHPSMTELDLLANKK